MADLFDENVEYRKSEKVEPPKFLAKLTIFGKILIFIHKIEFLCLIQLFRGIWRIFVPKRKKNIEGQVVLITGGGNGIGRQLAIEFAKEKCNIAIVDIDINAAKKLEEELISDYNIKAKAFKVDVSKVKEVENLKILIEDNLGSVDILVNNAGILTTNISFFEGAHDHIQKIIDVNLTSHFWFLRVFIKDMIEKERGHIIAMCSILGKTSIPLAGIYAATKHGVAGLMDALECDLKLFEFDFIKTTTVFPFFVETRKELVDTVKGYGIQMPTVTPQEIAKVIVQGMRKNARKIYYPSLYKLSLIEKILPGRVSLESRICPTISEEDIKKLRAERKKIMMDSLSIRTL